MHCVSVVKWVFSAHVLESLRGELFSKQRRIVEQGLRRQRPYVVLLVFLLSFWSAAVTGFELHVDKSKLQKMFAVLYQKYYR